MNLVFALGLAVALVAAARSTWSPCGLSMLSTITPVTEQGRGRRYAATVPWYLLGALAGGATLGGVAALVSIPVGAADIPEMTVFAIIGLFGVVSIFSDLGVKGFRLPRHRRQVDRLWLDHYRSWVYGTGFGWQIGVGLATYIVTSAVYLTVLIAILTGSPIRALTIGVVFGAVRGLAIFLGVRATTLERLHALHRGLTRFEPQSRAVMFAIQAAVATLAMGEAWGKPAGGVTMALVIVVCLFMLRRGRVRPMVPDRTPTPV
jgi:MFS family permease